MGDTESLYYVRLGASAIAADNYSLSGNTLTLKKEYLATKPTGSYSFLIVFKPSGTATLAVTVIQSATINPASGAFDRNPAEQADVATTITWNDASSVTGVKLNGTPIGADYYFVSGNTLTIRKEYLDTLPLGGVEFNVCFNEGAPATLTITITDSIPAPVAPTITTDTLPGVRWVRHTAWQTAATTCRMA